MGTRGVPRIPQRRAGRVLAAALGRGGHGDRGGPGLGPQPRSLSRGREVPGPQAPGEWGSLVLRHRAGGPVPFRTTMEEAGEEPQHQADHGGAALKGAVLPPRCHRPPRNHRAGAAERRGPDTGTPGTARSHGNGRGLVPAGAEGSRGTDGGGDRAPPVRGVAAAASLLPPLSSPVPLARRQRPGCS